MTPSESTTELIGALERDDQVVESTLRRVRAEIATYASVPDHLIVASADRNLRRAARTLMDGAVPASAEIWEAEESTLERLRAGLPIEDMLGGFRVSISCIQDRLIELADESKTDSAEVVRLTRLLWKLSDAFSAQAAATYRQQGMAKELAEQRLKDEWLLSALTGEIDADALGRCLTVLGLDREGSYVPFCARETNADVLESTQRALAAQFPEQACMMVLSKSRLVGLLARAPEPIGDLAIAIGPAVEPARLHSAFKVARRVLDATGPADVGIYSMDRLGWRVGVEADPQLSEFLRDRYIMPLEKARGSAEHMIESVRTYLEKDQSIPQAAEALHVHVNTLRYRLARFEKLTGKSLTSTDTVVEVSWVLHLVRTKNSEPATN